MSSERFYYDGLIYKTEEEFYRAVSHHANSGITPISADRILQDMCKTISMNLFLHGHEKDFCNAELKGICEETLLFFIQKYREKLGPNERYKQ